MLECHIKNGDGGNFISLFSHLYRMKRYEEITRNTAKRYISYMCPYQQAGNDIFSISLGGQKKDYIKELFLDVLKKAKTRYFFRCKSFCIMGNHVHLMIEITNNESISRLMQWILSVFALKYNRIHNYKGHVWYDR